MLKGYFEYNLLLDYLYYGVMVYLLSEIKSELWYFGINKRGVRLVVELGIFFMFGYFIYLVGG